MELKEFIENFAEQMDDMDATSLSSETRFRDLEDWSSLVALMVLAMIDETYDVSITGDEMRRAKTIGELFEIVKAKL